MTRVCDSLFIVGEELEQEGLLLLLDLDDQAPRVRTHVRGPGLKHTRQGPGRMEGIRSTHCRPGTRVGREAMPERGLPAAAAVESGAAETGISLRVGRERQGAARG